MKLKDLCGEHLLSGVDRENKRVKLEWGNDFEDCQTISFVLDGVTYSAVEDPDDGYRSHRRELLTTNEPVKHTFEPCRVVGRMRRTSRHEKNDVLELIDVSTGKTVLSVGTANTDDYTYFVAEWSPENLTHNSNAGGEVRP